MWAFEYIPSPTGDPYYNQAYEELCFLTYKAGSQLMLWENEPAVVIGKHQNLFAEVNLWQLRGRDMALVRRESGGGAVTHGPGNLNYSVMTDVGTSWDANAYAKVMIEALRALGVPAEAFQHAGIAIGGLKVSGSAQRLRQGRVLHHGTLLFDADGDWIRGALHRSESIVETRGTKSRPAPITNIRPHLGNDLDMAGFSAALRNLLCGERVVGEVPNAAETETLVAEKYRTWDWTFARSPGHRYQHAFAWRGEICALDYRCKGGLLEEVLFVCDGRRQTAFCEKLTGSALQAESLLDIASTLYGAEDAATLAPQFFR